MRGCIYIITNKAMPGLIKIGFSTKAPEVRAKALAGTGNPHRYVVEYDLLVQNPRAVEQKVHKSLSHCREGKEWFRCSVQEGISTIKQQAGTSIADRSGGDEQEAAVQPIRHHAKPYAPRARDPAAPDSAAEAERRRALRQKIDAEYDERLRAIDQDTIGEELAVPSMFVVFFTTAGLFPTISTWLGLLLTVVGGFVLAFLLDKVIAEVRTQAAKGRRGIELAKSPYLFNGKAPQGNPYPANKTVDLEPFEHPDDGHVPYGSPAAGTGRYGQRPQRPPWNVEEEIVFNRTNGQGISQPSSEIIGGPTRVAQYCAALRTALAKGFLVPHDLTSLRECQLNLGVTDAERDQAELKLLGETADLREQKDCARRLEEKREREKRDRQYQEKKATAQREEKLRKGKPNESQDPETLKIEMPEIAMQTGLGKRGVEQAGFLKDLQACLAKGYLTAYDLAELRVVQLNLQVTDVERAKVEVDLLGETSESREQKDTARREAGERERRRQGRLNEEREQAARREEEKELKEKQARRDKEEQDRLYEERKEMAELRKQGFLRTIQTALRKGHLTAEDLTRFRQIQIDLDITDADRCRYEVELLGETTIAREHTDSATRRADKDSGPGRDAAEDWLPVAEPVSSPENREKADAIRAYSRDTGMRLGEIVSKLKTGELMLVRNAGIVHVRPRH